VSPPTEAEAEFPVEEPLPAALRAHLEQTFELEREIGRGGMATVWLARRRSDGASVAIKVLQPSLARSLGVQRFLREIRIASQTHSPHLVPLQESGEQHGLPYYVMPYIEGESLRERLTRERELPVAEAVRIGRAVAEGLAALHRDGIVHRDIKPENILLRADGEVLVADYGIARALTASATEHITSTGIVLGTPAYMSPEQAAGDSVDARSDQYAWGCIQYEMLAGVPPFHGASSQAVMARHMHETPPSLRVVRASVPEALEQVVWRAMGKSAADRYESVSALLEALARVDLADLQSHQRRRRLRQRGAVAAIALGLGGTAGYFALRPGPPLDPGRVVVFPFSDLEPGHEHEGEQVTILVGSALERIEPTRWLDGWSLLTSPERAAAGGLPPGRAVSLTRAQHARWYLDGSIVHQRDSLRVIVTLHDLEQHRDTSAAASGAADAVAADLGLNAAIGLLPRLTGLETVVDVSSLRGRSPAAVSDWLRGEREYRQSRFRPALDYLGRAIAADDQLASAALRGATAALWLNRGDTALALVAAALRHPQSLAPRQAAFAAALRLALVGRADSAVIGLRRVLALDDKWPDAWMLLGEVNLHLLPSISLDSARLRIVPEVTDWPLESWAEEAFGRALSGDPGFTPPVAHLAEIAARRGDLGAFSRYSELLKRSNADSLQLATTALIGSCLSRSPRQLDWKREAEHGQRVLYRLGVILQGARYPQARECAERAFSAILASDPRPNDEDWGSLFGLHAMLVARGDTAKALAVADSAIASGMTAALGLFVVDAAAGIDPGHRVDGFVAQLDAAMDSRGAPSLWLLTLWSARTRDTGRLLRVRAALQRRQAAATATRLDTLIANVSAAYLALARSDSSGALRQFARLAPSAGWAALQTSLWEPLAPERLQYARLLLAQGRYASAHRVASVIDQPGLIVNPLFLRASLALRSAAARALRDERLRSQDEERLRALSDSAR